MLGPGLVGWLCLVCSVRTKAFILLGRGVDSRRYFFELDIIILLDEGVEAILDFVLWSSGEALGDLRPLASYLTVKLQYPLILFLRPVLPLDPRVQFVDIPLSDLLAVLGAEHLGDELPVLAVLLDEPQDGLVLLGRPNLMALAELHQSPVAVQALILIAVGHQLSDFRPFFREAIIELQKLKVLLVGPSFDLSLAELVTLLSDFHVHLTAIFAHYCNHKLSLHFFY